MAGPLAAAQNLPPPGTEIDTSHFDGFENWPLYRPGELRAENDAIADQRILYKAQFPSAAGLQGPLEDTIMMMDLHDLYFRGEPALWVQWTSTGRRDDPAGTASIDMLIADKASHRLLYRIQSVGGPGGPPVWAPPLSIQSHMRSKIIDVNVTSDGETETKTLESDDAGTIDFATLQFWLPFIGLEEGMKFRVPYYQRQREQIGGLPVQVVGRAEIVDANGDKHDVWRVQTMSDTRASLIEFWISEDAPYFMGWDFRLTRDGRRVAYMEYMKHWLLPRD
ncbi:MAG: hypothetical protein Tsb0010_16330 [Parvularculaceae bacterium]